MLGGGGHPAGLKALGEGHTHLRDRRGIRSEGAALDGRGSGGLGHVEHRRQIDVDPQPPQIGTGLLALVLRLALAPALPEVGRRDVGRTALQPLHRAALLVDHHQQRGVLARAGRGLELLNVGLQLRGIALECDHPADLSLPHPLQQRLVRSLRGQLRDDRLADEALERHGLLASAAAQAGDEDDQADHHDERDAADHEVLAPADVGGQVSAAGAPAGWRTASAPLELARVAALAQPFRPALANRPERPRLPPDGLALAGADAVTLARTDAVALAGPVLPRWARGHVSPLESLVFAGWWTPLHPRQLFPPPPLMEMPSSRSWLSSTRAGAPVSGSLPEAVFGKAITSRIESVPWRSAVIRSRP